MTTNPDIPDEPTSPTEVVVGKYNGQTVVAARMAGHAIPWIIQQGFGRYVWRDWPRLCDELTDIRVEDVADLADKAAPEPATGVPDEDVEEELGRGHGMTAAELPDFTTAPAWMSHKGMVWSLADIDECGDEREMVWGAPWTPLDTPGGHVKRIDRAQLTQLIQYAIHMGTTRDLDAFAHDLAGELVQTLPTLMGGTRQ